MRRIISKALTFILGAVALTGCSDAALGPSSDQRPLALALAVASGPAEAFDRADRLAVRVVAGDVVLLDTIIAFTPAGGDVRTRLRLPRDTDADVASVGVEVRLGNEPLFTGSAPNVSLVDRSDPVEITLQPVVARILGPATMPTITTLGGSVRIEAAAVFATGDTIPDTPFTWTALDPGVVSVSGDGTVTALQEGDARVEVRYGSVAATVTVRVRAIVASLQVAPDRATIFVGAAQTFTATPLDQAGNALVRPVTWQSSDPGIASIDTNGRAAGVSVGTVTIAAMVEDITGTAELTVVPALPAAPTGLEARPSGSTVRLIWTDNATNETSYQIRRGPAGATGGELVATLGANVTQYDETPGPDQILQYFVLACNESGCSTAASVSTRTVPHAPSSLRGRVTNANSGGFVLEWVDASAAETSFVIEWFVEDFDSETGTWETLGTAPANSVSQAFLLGYYVEYGLFRVFACNEAGCSAPSNEAELFFFTSVSRPQFNAADRLENSRAMRSTGRPFIRRQAPR